MNLLPCPFCGGEAKVIGFDAPERWVVCQSCKASGQSFSLEATATAAWNRRAPSAAYAAGAEAMRERAAVAIRNYYRESLHGHYGSEHIRALPLPAGGSGWRPIETAPRDGTCVFCYAPGTPDRAAKMRVDYWWVEQRAFAHMRPDQPYSHWQPLPAAPDADLAMEAG